MASATSSDATVLATFTFTIGIVFAGCFLLSMLFLSQMHFMVSRIPVWIATRDWAIFKPHIPKFFYWLSFLHPLLWIMVAFAPFATVFAWGIALLFTASDPLTGVAVLCLVPAGAMVIHGVLYWYNNKYRLTNFPRLLFTLGLLFCIAYIIIHAVLSRPFSFRATSLVFFSISFLAMIKVIYMYVAESPISFDDFLIAHVEKERRKSNKSRLPTKGEPEEDSSAGFDIHRKLASKMAAGLDDIVSSRPLYTALWFLLSSSFLAAFVVVVHFSSTSDESLTTSDATFVAALVACSVVVVDACSLIVESLRLMDDPATLALFLLGSRLLLVAAGYRYWFIAVSFLYVIVSCFLVRGSLNRARWWKKRILDGSRVDRFRQLKKIDKLFRTKLQRESSDLHRPLDEDGSQTPHDSTNHLMKAVGAVGAVSGKLLAFVVGTPTNVITTFITRYTQPALYLFVSLLYAGVSVAVGIRDPSNSSLYMLSSTSIAISASLVVIVDGCLATIQKLLPYAFPPRATALLNSEDSEANQPPIRKGIALSVFSVFTLVAYGTLCAIGVVIWQRDSWLVPLWVLLFGFPACSFASALYHLWIHNDYRWYDERGKRSMHWGSSLSRVHPLLSVESSIPAGASQAPAANAEPGSDGAVRAVSPRFQGAVSPRVPPTANSPQNAGWLRAFLFCGLTKRDYGVFTFQWLAAACVAGFSSLSWYLIKPWWISWTAGPCMCLLYVQSIVLVGWVKSSKFSVVRMLVMCLCICGWVALFVLFYILVFLEVQSKAWDRLKTDSDAVLTDLQSPLSDDEFSRYDVPLILIFFAIVLIFPTFAVEYAMMHKWHDLYFASTTKMLSFLHLPRTVSLQSFSLWKLLSSTDLWFSVASLSTFCAMGVYCWIWGTLMGLFQGFVVFLIFVVLLTIVILSSRPTWIMTPPSVDSSSSSATPLPPLMESRLFASRFANYVLVSFAGSAIVTAGYFVYFRGFNHFSYGSWMGITLTMTAVLLLVAITIYVRFFFFLSPWADPQKTRFSAENLLPLFLYDESHDQLVERNDPLAAVVLACAIGVVYGIGLSVAYSPSTFGMGVVTLSLAGFVLFVVDKTHDADMAFSAITAFLTPSLLERMTARAKRKQYDVDSEVSLADSADVEPEQGEERVGELEDDEEEPSSMDVETGYGTVQEKLKFDTFYDLRDHVWRVETSALSTSYLRMLQNMISHCSCNFTMSKDEESLLTVRFDLLRRLAQLDVDLRDAFHRQARFTAHLQSLLIATARYKRKQQLSLWCEFVRLHPVFGEWARAQTSDTLAFLLDDCLAFANAKESGEKARPYASIPPKIDSQHQSQTTNSHGKRTSGGLAMLQVLFSKGPAEIAERSEEEIGSELIIAFQTHVLDEEEKRRIWALKEKEEEMARKRRVQDLAGGMGFVDAWEKRCARGIFGFMYADGENVDLNGLRPEVRKYRSRLEKRYVTSSERKLFENSADHLDKEWMRVHLAQHPEDVQMDESDIRRKMIMDDIYNDAMSILLLRTQVRLVVAECSATGEKFTDYDFPPVEQSLAQPPAGTDPADFNMPVFASTVSEWRRCSEFAQGGDLFEAGVSPSDILQGQLGDCWFISALAVYAKDRSGENPQIPALFVVPEVHDYETTSDGFTVPLNPYGVYGVRFCKDGCWVGVVIDDFLPALGNGVPAYVSSRSGSEFWGSLLEKAYAKLHQSYGALIAGKVHDALVDMTGGVGVQISLTSNETEAMLASGELWARLVRYVAQGYLLGAASPTGSDADVSEYGVQQGHAYSILDVQEISVQSDGSSLSSLVDGSNRMGDSSTVRLLQLRNPWGSTEWTGDWGDTSPLWTESTRAQITAAQQMRHALLMQRRQAAIAVLAQMKGSALTPMDLRRIGSTSPRVGSMSPRASMSIDAKGHQAVVLSSHSLLSVASDSESANGIIVRSGADVYLDALARAGLLHAEGEEEAVDPNDGTFWMSLEDFARNFGAISVCKVFDSTWRRVVLHGKWIPGQTAGGPPNLATGCTNPQFALLVRQPGTFLIIIEQGDCRGIEDDHGREGGYLKICFVVAKKGGNRVKTLTKKTLVAQTGPCTNLRSLSIERELAALPEPYTLFPCTHLPDVTGEFRFIIYSTCDFDAYPIPDTVDAV